ncbi:glycosyltransferase family 4 protein [Candidatus Nomurabacteria bacterium CG10_big_fil_rev_8_21_14_0_10_35_16]|uniref:Glycosyltransferase family 4 protein n=1 Tax=Candidatus Nomurabacteria bacterium CG10_big_fil_rev_8_21_14_0_10_35_16 TaxID=1974731 RepID=A0A2H0TBN5_9BACT|nr:MAG: glycosyltransferase family 4 protein [Candidatus Nomurabacteria bacterium CG10_big_fil_rev_8_21_14_0_10_35_16]
MKVALMHDYLNQYGGAERVLETLCEIFPDAPIYTLFYDKEKTLGKFEGRIKKVSFLNNPIVSNNHRLFIPFMPIAASFLNVEGDYDIILSSSAGYGKGFRYGNKPHIAYCHTPLRYAWESKNYFIWGPFLKSISEPIFKYLRTWDYRAAQKPNIFLANSNYIANKIKNYYKREAEVLYPPVDFKTFYIDNKVEKRNHFLAVGRMIHYKKFDLIIRAFNKMKLPLIVVGEGPELNRLKKIANPANIKFFPFVKTSCLRDLYNEAEAVIFPQVEDFGLVAAEAQACGTPVIALNDGGAREIIEDGKTGVLFKHQTENDLIIAVKKFLLYSFDRKYISESARKFSKTRFKNKIIKVVQAIKQV